MSDAPRRPSSNPPRPDATHSSAVASAPPHGAPSNSNPADARSPWALFPWLVVIAALGGVWWWFAASEPAAPPTSRVPHPVDAETKSPGARAAKSASPGEWAEALKRRELGDIADRRSQAARQLMQRQGLGATDRHPDWNRARVLGAIAPGNAPDAGTPSR